MQATLIRAINTYNKEHKRTRGPGEAHIITISAKQQATRHCEDHAGEEADDIQMYLEFYNDTW